MNMLPRVTLEMLVALNVVDDEAYQTYRNEMTPILHRYGGSFGYDFGVAKVFKSETTAPINRVFTIRFVDKDSKESFFSDEEYLEVKQRHFETSVADTTIIATYNVVQIAND